jgi:hypothetical protein
VQLQSFPPNSSGEPSEYKEKTWYIDNFIHEKITDLKILIDEHLTYAKEHNKALAISKGIIAKHFKKPY